MADEDQIIEKGTVIADGIKAKVPSIVTIMETDMDMDIDEALQMHKTYPPYMTEVARVLTYHYTKKNSI